MISKPIYGLVRLNQRYSEYFTIVSIGTIEGVISIIEEID